METRTRRSARSDIVDQPVQLQTTTLRFVATVTSGGVVIAHFPLDTAAPARGERGSAKEDNDFGHICITKGVDGFRFGNDTPSFVSH